MRRPLSPSGMYGFVRRLPADVPPDRFHCSMLRGCSAAIVLCTIAAASTSLVQPASGLTPYKPLEELCKCDLAAASCFTLMALRRSRSRLLQGLQVCHFGRGSLAARQREIDLHDRCRRCGRVERRGVCPSGPQTTGAYTAGLCHSSPQRWNTLGPMAYHGGGSG